MQRSQQCKVNSDINAEINQGLRNRTHSIRDRKKTGLVNLRYYFIKNQLDDQKQAAKVIQNLTKYLVTKYCKLSHLQPNHEAYFISVHDQLKMQRSTQTTMSTFARIHPHIMVYTTLEVYQMQPSLIKLLVPS